MFSTAKSMEFEHHLLDEAIGGCSNSSCPYHWRPWFAWHPVPLIADRLTRPKTQWAWWRVVMRRKYKPNKGWDYEEPFIIALYPTFPYIPKG